MSAVTRIKKLEEALSGATSPEACRAADSAVEHGLIPPSEFEAFAREWQRPGFWAQVKAELQEARA